MSYQSEFSDFTAFANQKGHKQAAIADAWDDFAGLNGYRSRGAYNGPMHQFFDERKETHAFRYNTAAVEQPGHPALYNLTAQTAYFKEVGQQACTELLTANGLKLGQIKPAPKDEAVPDNSNPYSPKFRGTPAEKEAAINGLIRRLGTAKANTFANGQGYSVDGRPLRS
jgi:hypothetical protein